MGPGRNRLATSSCSCNTSGQAIFPVRLPGTLQGGLYGLYSPMISRTVRARDNFRV